MHVLAVDTASAAGSVALLMDDRPVMETVIRSGRNHSITILPAIADLLESAGMAPGALDLLAVTTGPGSFTGLRIGVSLIKGLALSISKPVVSVSTLDALAMNCFASRYPICTLLDAKRGQVYASLYEPRSDGMPEKIRPESVEDPRLFLESIRSNVVLTGDGIDAYGGLIEEVLGGRCLIAPSPLRLIRASAVGLLALEKFRRGDFLDAVSLTPRYIRASEAERAERQIENA